MSNLHIKEHEETLASVAECSTFAHKLIAENNMLHKKLAAKDAEIAQLRKATE